MQVQSAGHYACVPLLTPDGTFGVLFVRRLDEVPEAVFEAQVAAATDVATMLAPALLSIRLRDKLRSQSIRDPLTGLFNRRFMEESLVREIHRAARGKRPLSVIMLDVDHFKRFNDEHGHGAGDTALKDMGGLLARQVREGDVVCRYGGEEFALILPEAALPDAQRRAEAIREAAAALCLVLPSGLTVSVTISQGVAAFPEHGRTADALLEAADRALYRAKGNGRNRVEAALAS